MVVIILSYLHTTKVKGCSGLNPTKWYQSLARSNFWCCVCVYKMAERGITKFEIPKFNGKNFAKWKIKMHAILVKNGYAIALKGTSLKLAGMTTI